MSRLKTLKVASLNIVIHPHSPDTYVNLLKEAYEGNIEAHVQGNLRSRIGAFREDRTTDGDVLISGYIYFYVSFDPTGKWLNINKNDEADEDDMMELNVPDHLKPEFRRTRYIFVPKNHKFYFCSKNEYGNSFGPSRVQRALSKIFNNEKITRQYGDVTVTVIPSKEGVERVLNLENMSKLIISFQRPNPDDLAALEANLLQQMDVENVGRIDTTFSKQKGTEGIQPSEPTKSLAHIAAENGYVKSIGRKDGKAAMESTVDHPEITPITYNENSGNPFSALINFVIGRH